MKHIVKTTKQRLIKHFLIVRCRKNETVRIIFFHEFKERIKDTAHFTNFIIIRPVSSDRIKFIKQIYTAFCINLVKYSAELCTRFTHELGNKAIHLNLIEWQMQFSRKNACG